MDDLQANGLTDGSVYPAKRASHGCIRTLTPEVVSLMAAGEVIDSLAAVVRELVENALDAGASRIAVSLWPAQWQVRVADNGTGMNRANLQQAAVAHATSKISTRPDLLNVRSLGFRGEALHSIAQLAQLEICTRPRSDQGYQASYSAEGQPQQVKEVAIAPGTIVTASDLFHTWQARRQVPSPSQQVKAVTQLMQQFALCHPQVTWQIEKDGVPWLSLWPGPTAKTLMAQMLRNVHASDLKELMTDGLYLAVGLPDRCYRRRPDWVRVAINGRPVEVSELSAALINGFRRTLPRDRYPVCFLHLTLPPSHLDWNRHPAKSEIYVQELGGVSDRITAAVTDILQTGNLTETAQNQRATALVKAAEESGSYQVSRQIQPGVDDLAKAASVNLSDALPGEVPGSLKALAQVHNMYILAEHEGGLCLIEQHIAHERVLYEQLQQRWQMVPVESPIILADLQAEQVAQLVEIGLEVAAFGDRLWAVRTVPQPLKDRADCAEALSELSRGANLEAALVATACRTAIRNGKALSQPEMQRLVNQWQGTARSRTCPHGRPICLSLKEASLAKYFRRSWVIGKSHGI